MNQKLNLIDNIEVKRTIAKEVARQHSYLVGYFTKTSVPDLVVTQWAAISISSPEFLQFIANEFGKIINKIEKVDLLCGIETAGIALAAATSVETGMPWIYARKDRKKSGGMEAFEGTYKKGDKIVFIDNFSATGKGLLPMMKHADEEGFAYKDLIVICDNEWDKVDAFSEKITTHALITNRELTFYLNEIGYFPGNLYKYCQMYLDEPERLKPGLPDTLDFIEELKKAPEEKHVRKETLLRI